MNTHIDGALKELEAGKLTPEQTVERLIAGGTPDQFARELVNEALGGGDVIFEEKDGTQYYPQNDNTGVPVSVVDAFWNETEAPGKPRELKTVKLL